MADSSIDFPGDVAIGPTGPSGPSGPTGPTGSGSGAWEFVSETIISSDVTIDITGLATGFDYLFSLQNVLPATDAVQLHMRTSTDGGSSYDSGASDYVSADSATEAEIIITGAPGLGNVAGEGMSGEIVIFNPGDTKQTHVSSFTAAFGANGAIIGTANQGFGKRNSAADVDAVRFLMASGNIASGEIRVYKRVHS